MPGATMRFIKKVLGRGNITLPTEIRESLDIEEGDIVEFEIHRIIKRRGVTETVMSVHEDDPKTLQNPHSAPDYQEDTIQ